MIAVVSKRVLRKTEVDEWYRAYADNRNDGGPANAFRIFAEKKYYVTNGLSAVDALHCAHIIITTTQYKRSIL